ncbi:MAG: hypothetical protein U9Q81_21285 [Pseudomonadota bacterium]|nr:hypothetical protein [Pseudomonadota bacterium]
MYSMQANVAEVLGDFRIEGVAMRYSQFVPRLYNLCLSMGFKPGKIMPSRAFCSDESQGYPIILIAKHFGTFPFNHGQVGGIVATDRHGPHAHHGQDLVIILASHVGYDPDTARFGDYRRQQTDGLDITTNCGKICGVLHWYQDEYRFAQHNILLRREAGRHLLVIDNQLLREDREEGLFLRLDRLARRNDEDGCKPLKTLSTAKAFEASPQFRESLPDALWEGERGTPIGQHLTPDLFTFRREIPADVEGRHHLEANLFDAMPYIVTARWPALVAAQINTQVEFDRTFRTIVKSDEYRGHHLLFIAGINIDVSPREGQLFPLTKFVPWAAYVQSPDGNGYTLEQAELVQRLRDQSPENPLQIDLEAAIQAMRAEQEVKLQL